jgi:hypothetical protein
VEKLIILNERHLRRTLDEYMARYNARRAHQGLEQDSSLGLVPVSSQRPVRCRQVLAGIIKDYYREAAQCSFPLVDQFLDTTGVK